MDQWFPGPDTDCCICISGFYGREYYQFSDLCEQPHALHRRCALRCQQNGLLNTCPICRVDWVNEDHFHHLKMPDDLPPRLYGGGTPPLGYLSQDDIPLPEVVSVFFPNPSRLPNDDVTYCFGCGKFLYPDNWGMYGTADHPLCLVCLGELVRGIKFLIELLNERFKSDSGAESESEAESEAESESD